MITADANFVLFEGSKVVFNSVSIWVDFKYSNKDETFFCELLPLGVAAATGTPQLGEYSTILTKAAVDAKTGTGTETEAILDAIELVIIDYLDALTENSAVTFTN